MPTKKNTSKKPSATKKKTKKSTTKPKEPTTEEQIITNQNKFIKSTIYLSIGVVIVLGIMLALIFGPKYFQEQQLEKDSYNNFQFVQQDDFWFVKIQVNNNPYSILMHHHPEELESVLIEPRTITTIKNLSNKVAYEQKGRLYITMDPEAPSGLAIAGVELAKVLGEKFNIYNIPTQAAFIKPLEGYGQQTPIKNCQDATNDTIVMYIREADNNYVGIPSGYDNCIVLQATNANETIKVADAFIYHLLGVMT